MAGQERRRCCRTSSVLGDSAQSRQLSAKVKAIRPISLRTQRKHSLRTLGRLFFSRPDSLGVVLWSANLDPSGPDSRPSVLYEQRDSRAGVVGKRRSSYTVGSRNSAAEGASLRTSELKKLPYKANRRLYSQETASCLSLFAEHSESIRVGLSDVSFLSRPESLGVVLWSANLDPSRPDSPRSILYEQRDSLHSCALFRHTLRAETFRELHERREERALG